MKKNRKSVSLITFHSAYNYGAVLQTVALTHFLEAHFGIRPLVLDYRANAIGLADFIRFFPVAKSPKDILSGIKTTMNRLRKRTLFRDFSDQYILKTQHFSTMGSLRRHHPHTDVALCGSDQIWNPALTLGVNKAFFLDFCKGTVPIRAAYAASFGRQTLTPRELAQISPLIKSLDALSVREESGVSLIEQMVQRTATSCVDPTFLLDAQDWVRFSQPPRVEGEYILIYKMQNLDSLYDTALKCKEATGLPIVEISNYGCKREGIDHCLTDVGPAEFVGFFQNAAYICTNSYHGLLFSLIFGKRCFVHSGFRWNERSRYVLSLICQEEKCITPDTVVGNADLMRFCITADGRMDDMYRKKAQSIDYLEQVLEQKADDWLHTVTDLPQGRCCGCSACVQACPEKCLQMAWQEGFQYPAMADADACTKCGKCLRVCPVLPQNQAADDAEPEFPKAYGGWIQDEPLRRESSSGGYFSVLANAVLGRGGHVYGAVLSPDLSVVHTLAASTEELRPMRGSKYVQSDISGTYAQVRLDLEAGIPVLFSGTPCQLAGLHLYLGKAYPGLYLADVACHGVPSPMVFRAYTEALQRKYPGEVLSDFKFRTKKNGWDQSGFKKGTEVRFESGRTAYNTPAYKDSYMVGFLTDVFLRECCYQCAFKTREKTYSDFTLADFWGVGKLAPHLDDQRGTSSMLVHSSKGAALLEACDGVLFETVDAQSVYRTNPMLLRSVAMNPKREGFMASMEATGYSPQTFAQSKSKYLSPFQWFKHQIIKRVRRVWPF